MLRSTRVQDIFFADFIYSHFFSSSRRLLSDNDMFALFIFEPRVWFD